MVTLIPCVIKDSIRVIHLNILPHPNSVSFIIDDEEPITYSHNLNLRVKKPSILKDYSSQSPQYRKFSSSIKDLRSVLVNRFSLLFNEDPELIKKDLSHRKCFNSIINRICNLYHEE